MKKKELKNMSAGELERKVSEMEESLRALRFKSEGAKSKNVKEAWALRKSVARALTFMNEQKRNAK